ncbi:MAG: NDP-sugar synthase [Acidobacteria bacterium]|nr:MAG: NDP-sugar synthase [Acidobacteriota bacterium]
MKGMILAAGLGTRLHPLTDFRAKAAVPFLNRPLIHYAWELLAGAGLQEIMINSHHLPHSIEAAVQDLGTEGQKTPSILFSHETERLGTAGAIGKVRDFLAGDTFVVCSGKIYFEQELDQAIGFHQETESLVTLVLVPYSDEYSYNPVFLDDQNNITGFGPTETGTHPDQPHVFTGVHILDPKILDFIPAGPSETVNDLYPRFIQEGYRVQGFVSKAYWCECSTPQRYLMRSLEVLQNRGLDNLIEGEASPLCQGVVAPRSVQIDGSSVVKDSVLWDDVKVGPNSSISGVIVTNGVTLGPETHLENAIVTPLPEKTEPLQAAQRVGDSLIWPL